MASSGEGVTVRSTFVVAEEMIGKRPSAIVGTIGTCIENCSPGVPLNGVNWYFTRASFASDIARGYDVQGIESGITHHVSDDKMLLEER